MIVNMVNISMLNFNILCATEKPSNPKENTIWIRSNTEMTRYAFRITEPEVTEEGYVWIKTSTKSDAWFNALKSNTIVVSPIAAYQYKNDTFELRDAYIYQNGIWIQFSVIVSDVIVYGENTDNVASLSDVSRKDSYLLANLGLNGDASIKSDLIDITHHKTVMCEYSHLICDTSDENTFSGGIRIRILDKSNTRVAYSGRKTENSGTVILDVSELVGLYYIQIYMNNTSGSFSGSCRVTSIEANL